MAGFGQQDLYHLVRCDLPIDDKWVYELLPPLLKYRPHLGDLEP